MRGALLLSLTACGLGSAPPTPEGLFASEGNAKVFLSWGAVPTATSYNLYWTDDGSRPDRDSDNALSVEGTFHLHETANDRTHTYVVTALDGDAESGESEPVIADPPGLVGGVLVSFTLCCSSLTMGYALWVEDEQGNYVDTVVHYRDYNTWVNARMPTWQAKRASDLDGITHASTLSGQSLSYVWDGKDHNNRRMPRGSYRMRLEVSDWSWPNCLSNDEVDAEYRNQGIPGINCNVDNAILYQYSTVPLQLF